MKSKSLALSLAMVAAATLARTAVAQTAIPPAPREFVDSAVQSDEYEILAAHVALAESHTPQIRAFAAQMIRDHTQMESEMRHAAAASGFPPPAHAISSDQSRLLAALQSLRGSEFDKTYARQQVLAHQETLAVGQSFAKAGHNPTLQKAARAAMPQIQHHLELARQIRAVADNA